MTKHVSHEQKEARVFTLTSIQSAQLYINAVRSLGTRKNVGFDFACNHNCSVMFKLVLRIKNNILGAPETDWYKVRSSRSFNSSNNSGFVKQQPWHTPVRL
jgi:hypothetical protein